MVQLLHTKLKVGQSTVFIENTFNKLERGAPCNTQDKLLPAKEPLKVINFLKYPNRKQLKKIFYFQWLICWRRFVLCLLIMRHGAPSSFIINKLNLLINGIFVKKMLWQMPYWKVLYVIHFWNYLHKFSIDVAFKIHLRCKFYFPIRQLILLGKVP